MDVGGVLLQFAGFSCLGVFWVFCLFQCVVISRDDHRDSVLKWCCALLGPVGMGYLLLMRFRDRHRHNCTRSLHWHEKQTRDVVQMRLE